MRVAALPNTALLAYMRFLNFFSAKAFMNAARSSGRIFTPRPTVRRSLTTASGPRQQRLRLHRIVRGRRRRPVEVEAAGNDAAGDSRRAEQLGLVVALAVEGEGGGLTHRKVVPGRR